MYGRVVNVVERHLGSVLTTDAVATGYIGVLASGTGTGSTLVLTLAADAAGDSIVIAGGQDANDVPTSIVDSRGNTYYLAPRAGHGGSGPDIVSTTGLSSTVWLAHGVYDGGQLRAGDTITLTYPHSEAQSAAAALDCSGVGAVDSDDTGSAGGDFGLISTRQTFNPATATPGLTVADDNSLYVAAVYGSRHKQHIDPITAALINDFGDPSINEGTVVLAGVDDGERGLAVAADMVDAGAAPSREMSAGMGWAEGAVQAYKVVARPTIFVADTADLGDEGTIVIDPDGISFTVDYSEVNVDTGEVTLESPLPTNFSEGTEVRIYPLGTERWAILISGDSGLEEEGMYARVPHALYDKIKVGVRDLTAGEGETVQAEFAMDELVIHDVTGKAPTVDGSYIDPTTLPHRSDGFPPASPSPTPDVVVGNDHLKARWEAVALNANGDPQGDLVSYDVHVAGGGDVPATLEVGTGDGTYRLTAVTPGVGGNDITLTVTVS